jgi:hypothetical protein
MPPKPKRKRVPRDPVTVREGQDFMLKLLPYRERVAAFTKARFLDNVGEPIAGIKAADATKYGIPF